MAQSGATSFGGFRDRGGEPRTDADIGRCVEQPGLGDLQQATCGERRRLLAGRARADEGTACPSPGGNRVLQDVSRQPGREPAVSDDVRPRRLDVHDRDPHRNPQGADDGTRREGDPSDEQEVPRGVLHSRALEPEGRDSGRAALLRPCGRHETARSVLIQERDTPSIYPIQRILVSLAVRLNTGQRLDGLPMEWDERKSKRILEDEPSNGPAFDGCCPRGAPIDRPGPFRWENVRFTLDHRAATSTSTPVCDRTAATRSPLSDRPIRSPPGSAQRPPRSRPRGRRTRRTCPLAVTRPNNTGTTGVERGLRRIGSSRSSPAARARHQRSTGHRGQLGDVGVQTVAPSSIIAWLNAPGRSEETRRAAISATRRRTDAVVTSSRIQKSRAMTRVTFPSTAGTGSPKAILPTAPAV